MLDLGDPSGDLRWLLDFWVKREVQDKGDEAGDEFWQKFFMKALALALHQGAMIYRTGTGLQ